MKVDVSTLDGKPITWRDATTAVGSALRIAPAFVAQTDDAGSGLRTIITAEYQSSEGRYIVIRVVNEATRTGAEVNNIALRQIPIQSILQAAAPKCIALTLDDESDTTAKWMTAAELSSTEGRIIPHWLAEQVVKRGSKSERMDVVELLYGTAALSGLPPVKAVQNELEVPHRTASDWIKKARAEGRLEGMSYIVGRQADG
ncbi:hypothetical protein [Microbacterium pumilum]|uniref:DNA-binding protein n=1 Tax=Microbacterium pumilum TaxID=344165 RepID=A0ABN2S2I9_9MICO